MAIIVIAIAIILSIIANCLYHIIYLKFFIYLLYKKSKGYGSKNPDGTWSGVIGDLVKGEIDIVVAGMTMTSEREEVVDFVAPYFDQSGISIIIREPVRARSLFKFMEVLRVEVWLAILAALIVTALMLWFLDRYVQCTTALHVHTK